MQFKFSFKAPILGVSFLVCSVAAATPVPSAPQLGARSYVLYDYHTGQVLVDTNGEVPQPPASLTKIMTAYLAFDALKQGDIKLEDEITISTEAWRTGGSRSFIDPAKPVPVEVLVHGVLTQSGNDATLALAQHMAGTEAVFADLMNAEAQRLGLTNTHFVNSHGLPAENHYSSALDMARLAAATIRDFPDYYPWYAFKSFTWNNITQPNRNRLLFWDSKVDGLKTGYTEAAGYCLVASRQDEDMRLIAVVMGSDSDRSRFREAQALFNWGFRFYETHRLFPVGEKRTDAPVFGGEQRAVPLGLAEDLYITVPRGQYDELTASVEVAPRLMAPVAQGSSQGVLRVKLGDEVLLERPLVALQAVEEGGLVRRAIDAVRLWWQE
ncbi:MAG TPA: serine-type D-Ala-D-Ala carboxypeptidase [Gammaproteobacteria bacterium]|uniref:D-alanyl-D-alanine carboxypeptidase family protein n=1 Tax=Immundisolibacter sp. TaxID=1934948 RepID=UPI000E854142|nr:serine-type D-Ala-D-Ala carboxypeptidase [Gammaproteobacteria bacterium]HCZ47511.1 serine-type D-Ala-D-Ala carboxypeptidase [Gammaproteobacteria bacterium]MCH76949.1 serine-type D-Ala-D-Ala carboxypeptidase [Gammaproteobacteria bacterium]